MTLNELLAEIDKDAKIDDAALDIESLRIPQLHAKYYRIFVTELKLLKAIEHEYRSTKKSRIHYYSGKAPDDEYRAAPLDHKIIRQDLDLYLDSDALLAEKRAKLDMQQVKVDTTEAFIKTLNNRNFLIKNAIDFLKFKNGQ